MVGALFTYGTQVSNIHFGCAACMGLGGCFLFLFLLFKAHYVFLVTFSLNTPELQNATSALYSIMAVLQTYAKHS